MDVKTALSKVKKAVKTKDLSFLTLVILETLFNSPATSRFAPSKLRRNINSKLLKLFENKSICLSFYGYKFFVPDYSAWIVLNESFEDKIYSIIKNNLDKTTTFVDVGAHVGKYTVTMAKYCKEVIAIEPDPQNFAYLKKNVEINGITNVQLYNCACYSKDCFVYFDSEKPSDVRKISSTGKIKVPAKTIDSILKNMELSRILLKIDVEGSEYDVLYGARDTIKKYKPMIICECWKHNWKKTVSFLNKYGYEFRIISSKNENVKDVLFLPKFNG